MASNSYIGNAPAISQVTSWTFGGTWLSSEIVTFTIGGKSVSFVTASATLATILTNLCNDFATLASSIWPEFVEIALTNDGSVTLIATAVTPGIPFTMTLSTNSVSGTIGAPAATVANSGPDNYTSVANWATGSLPASGDDVTMGLPGTAIRYGLSQSAVVLNSLTFIGPMTIGLPQVNSSGYYEYRPTYLALASATITFLPNVSTGSCFFQLDPGNHATAINVFGMGTPGGNNSGANSTYALALRGAAANYTLTIQQGVVGVAINTGESATLPTVHVGYESNVNSDVTLVLGAGCTTTTITQLGGSVTANSSVTTWTVSAGTATVAAAATVTTLTAFPSAQQTSYVSYQSTGTVTTLVAGPRATLDAQTVGLPRTITNSTFYAGSTLLDGNTTITFTNKPLFTGEVNECTIVRGSNRTVGI